MLSFIAQFSKQDGPNGAHQYKLILDIDEAHRAGFLPIAQHYSKGDTFLVLMLPVDEDFASFGEVINETKDMTINRLRKQMHALLREVATEKGLTVAEVKTSLKEMLKKKGHLEKSTSELGVKGFAAAIYLLQNEF